MQKMMETDTYNKKNPLSPFGSGFADIIGQYDWDETTSRINATTDEDVKRVMGKAIAGKTALTPEDFTVLISPAAMPYIHQMGELAAKITDARFGKTISMYIPMYVSNACTNKCVYCGFNHDNPFERTTLSMQQVKAECEAIKRLSPFDNILIVAGEYPALCGPKYLANVLDVCRPYFNNMTIEVQPMREEDYRNLTEHGLNGVVCFQETYNARNYRNYHPRGMKSHFEWRLNGFDRMGRAGVHKIGLGVLIGLEDWRTDVTMMARHLRYLQKKYWKTRYSVNFPRMRPSKSGYQPHVVMTDKELAQLTFAFRIFDHDIDISYSTRELPEFRDNMIPLGVTSMSAGSQTEPGGYASTPDALEQFTVSDSRTPKEVVEAIRQRGYEPVWKDWDAIFD